MASRRHEIKSVFDQILSYIYIIQYQGVGSSELLIPSLLLLHETYPPQPFILKVRVEAERFGDCCWISTPRTWEPPTTGSQLQGPENPHPVGHASDPRKIDHNFSQLVTAFMRDVDLIWEDLLPLTSIWSLCHHHEWLSWGIGAIGHCTQNQYGYIHILHLEKVNMENSVSLLVMTLLLRDWIVL